MSPQLRRALLLALGLVILLVLGWLLLTPIQTQDDYCGWIVQRVIARHGWSGQPACRRPVEVRLAPAALLVFAIVWVGLMYRRHAAHGQE